MISKRSVLSIIMLILIFFCCGCKDHIELEEQGYVSTIGIDKGKDDNISVTYQIINVKYGGNASTSSSAAGNEAKNETITFEAPDLIAARDLANTVIARRITLAHARTLVVGEEYAKSKNFFHIMESALRDKEFRRAANIIVSREKASDFLKNTVPVLEDRNNKYYDFMINRWKDTGMLPQSDLNKFMQRTEDEQSLYLAVYAASRKHTVKNHGHEADYLPGEIDIQGTNTTQMIGAAVFKDGKMIGSLTGAENRLAFLLRPAYKTGSMLFTFEDPSDNKYRISARIKKNRKNKVKIDISKNKPDVKVTVRLNAEILAIPSFAKYPENQALEEKLVNSIEYQLEGETNKLIKKTQTDFKGEPFLWSLDLRKKFLTVDDYRQYNWKDKYAAANVVVKYKIRIKNFGKQLNPPKEIKNS